MTSSLWTEHRVTIFHINLSSFDLCILFFLQLSLLFFYSRNVIPLSISISLLSSFISSLSSHLTFTFSLSSHLTLSCFHLIIFPSHFHLVTTSPSLSFYLIISPSHFYLAIIFPSHHYLAITRHRVCRPAPYDRCRQRRGLPHSTQVG